MKPVFSKIIFVAFLYTLLYSCGTSTNAYLKSKNPNISWMDKNSFKKKREIPRNLAFQDDKYLYCWDDASRATTSKSMPIYYQIDKNSLQIVKSSKNVKQEKFNSAYVFWNEKAGWLIYDNNKKNKIDEFKAMKISLDKVEPSKDLFRLDAEKSNSQLSEDFYLNSDSTKLTYITSQYIGKEDKLILDAVCFDFVSMTKLWKHRYVFPHPVKRRSDVSNIDIMVNKNGEPHFLIKTYFDKRKEKRKTENGVESNYNYAYYVLSEAGKVEEYVVDIKGSFVQSIEFPFANQKNPVIVAYAYTKNNFKELKSILFKQINLETKEILDLKEVQLDAKRLQIFDEESGKKIKQSKGFQGVGSLGIQKIHQSEDNAIYVLGEENVLIEHCYTDKNGFTRCTYYWRSGNILVTKVASDGKESWSKIIPKSQYIPAALGYNGTWKLPKAHSHASFMVGDKLHLFFNDHEKNYKSSKVTKITRWAGKKTSLVHVIVNPDGTYEMIEALGKKDHPKVVDINKIQKIDDDHVFIYDYKTIGKLKIDR